MANEILLKANERAERKTLITVAAWGEVSEGKEAHREILGVRTEDSSIELNPDIETITDILGITYTDVNKTEPQQEFDPFFIRKESPLAAYLVDAVLANNIQAYNNAFTLYIITAFLGEAGSSGTATKYACVKHVGCSIIPTSIGGDAYVSMPLEVHFSNNLTMGSVDKLTPDFAFAE